VSRDPTGTIKIRQAFRGEAQRRVARLRIAVRATMAENDMMGLSPPSAATWPAAFLNAPSGYGAKLTRFSTWFNNAAYAFVVEGGHWTRKYMDAAYLSGAAAAVKWTKVNRFPTMSETFPELAAHELSGVADATVQRVTRSVGNGLLAGDTATRMSQAANVDIRKIMAVRLNTLANYTVVRLHNAGRLDQFKLAGIDNVGIIPERVHRQHDALTRDQNGDVVEVVTAGDDDVCERCRQIAAEGPYDIDEAEGLIPAHGNCRCAFMPVEGALFFAPRETAEAE
jgi:hypothetical protein